MDPRTPLSRTHTKFPHSTNFWIRLDISNLLLSGPPVVYPSSCESWATPHIKARKRLRTPHMMGDDAEVGMLIGDKGVSNLKLSGSNHNFPLGCVGKYTQVRSCSYCRCVFGIKSSPCGDF